MKRLILCLLALALLLTFASCRKDVDKKPSVDTVDTGNDTEEGNERSDAVSSLPSDLDFDDVTINIVVRDRDDIAFEIDSERNSSDVLASDIYRRNDRTENELGVILKYTYVPGNWSQREEFLTSVRNNAAMSGAELYDIVMGANYCMTPLMMEEQFTNLIGTKYLDFEQPWWNSNFINECTLKNKLYIVEGELGLSMIDCSFVMFYDVELFKSLYPNESMRDLILDREWTFEKLKMFTNDVWIDDGNTQKDNLDTFGLVSPQFASGRDGFQTAFNIKIAEKQNGNLISVFNNERNIQIYSDFYTLLENNGIFVNGNNDGSREEARTMFQNGQSLFLSELLNYATILRTLNREYGVAPLPMYDESQGGYYTASEAVHSQISICKASQNKDAAAAVMEKLCYLTYRDVTLDYYDTVKYRNMSIPEAVEILDLIVASITSDVGTQFQSQISTPFGAVIGTQKDIAGDLKAQVERIDALIDIFQKKVVKLP